MDKVSLYSILFRFINIVSFHQLNCEELVEGYENPVAGVTRSADKEDNDDDDDGDDDISTDAGTSSKTKKSKSSSSSKSISILSRTTTEFETCIPEKSVEFDPVQGKQQIPYFLFFDMTRFIYYSLLQVRYVTLATVRRRTASVKSIRIRRHRSCAKRNNKFVTAKKPQTPPVKTLKHLFSFINK